MEELSFEDFDCSDVLPLYEEDEMAKRTEDYIEEVMIDSALIDDMYKIIAECLHTNTANISIDKAEFVRVGGNNANDYYLLSGTYWDGEEKPFDRLRYYPQSVPDVDQLEGTTKEIVNVLLQ